MSYAFISYSHKDKGYADRLEQELKQRGFDVWLDDRIDYGNEWPDEIEKRLDGCKALILIMTGHSKQSGWVKKEITRSTRIQKKIFPLLLEGDGPWLTVETTQYVDVRGGRLPPTNFYDTLAKFVPRRRVGVSEQIKAIPTSKPIPDKQQPKVLDVITNSIGINLVYIPPGSFIMGSTGSAAQLAKEYGADEACMRGEFPQHQVRISEGFWMGQTEVTQGQYSSLMNAEPWFGKDHVQEGADYPAVCVSWYDAVRFCAELSKREGETYRLPTEAEWEYACRAGTTTRFSFGDSGSSLGDYAWFKDNTYGQEYAHPVRQRKPNPWGLYDMHGNVWELCSDYYAEPYYSNSPTVDPKGPSSGVLRSGRGSSWYGNEVSLRCSSRDGMEPDCRHCLVGFRVVRSQS